MSTNFSALTSGEQLLRGSLDQTLHLLPDQLKRLREWVPHPVKTLPDHLDFQTGTITFKGGTPVGGWAQIRLYKNGNWEFWGHFHDSGTPSYDAGIGVVIVASDGTAFTFQAKVHLNGTFESGSRDGNWDKNGRNDLIANKWEALCAGHHWRWQANVNWDW